MLTVREHDTKIRATPLTVPGSTIYHLCQHQNRHNRCRYRHRIQDRIHYHHHRNHHDHHRHHHHHHQWTLRKPLSLLASISTTISNSNTRTISRSIVVAAIIIFMTSLAIAVRTIKGKRDEVGASKVRSISRPAFILNTSTHTKSTKDKRDHHSMAIDSCASFLNGRQVQIWVAQLKPHMIQRSGAAVPSR